jgi:hypothetical protein
MDMARSIPAKQKAKGRGRPGTGLDAMIGLRATPALLAAIEEWAACEPDSPSLSEAIRRLVEIALGSSGPARTRTKRRTAKASDMAGAAIDRLADQSAPPEVRAKRKRRLLKGPSEFRDMREDHPKPKR